MVMRVTTHAQLAQGAPLGELAATSAARCARQEAHRGRRARTTGQTVTGPT